MKKLISISLLSFSCIIGNSMAAEWTAFVVEKDECDKSCSSYQKHSNKLKKGFKYVARETIYASQGSGRCYEKFKCIYKK